MSGHPTERTKTEADEFARLVGKADMPRMRLHDLRHRWATLALAEGVPTKVVAERLGHSGTHITQDTYMHRVEELHRDAAETVAARFGRPI